MAATMVRFGCEEATRGWTRPGLYLQKHQDERLQYRWSAAFRAFQDSHPQIRALPPLILPML